MQVDADVFQRVAQTGPGREMVRELGRYLRYLDTKSRRMKGEQLEQNTIKRAFIEDFLTKFEAPQQQERSEWRE